jgi:hypothetical protein
MKQSKSPDPYQVTEKMIKAALVAQASSDGPPHQAMREALLAAFHIEESLR